MLHLKAIAISTFLRPSEKPWFLLLNPLWNPCRGQQSEVEVRTGEEELGRLLPMA